MTKRKGFGLLVAALAMAGCTPGMYRDSTTPIPGFGNAISQNNAVMVIDPQPAAAANVNLDLDGRRDAIAIERYRTNTVIPPHELRTSSGL